MISFSSRWRFAIVVMAAFAMIAGTYLLITPSIKVTEGRVPAPASMEKPGPQRDTHGVAVEPSKSDPEPGKLAGRNFLSIPLKELWDLYQQRGALGQRERALASKHISHRFAEGGQGPNAVRKEVANRLLDEALDERERAGLARILGESNTAEGLAALTDALLATRSSLLQRTILEQLGRMGIRQSPEQVHAMTQVSLSTWQRIGSHPDFGAALYPIMAGLLAKLGDPQGVGFVRDQAIAGGATLTQLDKGDLASAVAAMDASLQVRGTESIPLLAGTLPQNDPESTEFVWSGQALASMGRREATAALIEWARTAPDSCAEVSATWIGAVRDSRSHALVRELAASGASLPFASDRVKQAVLASASRLASP